MAVQAKVKYLWLHKQFNKDKLHAINQPISPTSVEERDDGFGKATVIINSTIRDEA
jgi:hypothetical protein